MRLIVRIAMAAAAALMLFGCNKFQSDTVVPKEGEDVSVCFTFQLPENEGESMTKVSNAEIFSAFYQKILSAELVAPQYNLTMEDENTGISYEFKGTWNKKDMVTVKTGRYHVVGTSTATGVTLQDKCSFVFDQYIDVTSSATQITLTAQYDCFLIIFNAAGITTLSNYDGATTRSLFNFNPYKYAFVNNQLYLADKQDMSYLTGRYSTGAEFKCYTGHINFQKGKYYVYNSVTGTFTVPPMEDGDGDAVAEEHNAVDLGLSVLWADTNIGANVPEQFGSYFGWGEVYPYDNDYHGPWPYPEEKSVLDPEDDAAHVLWGDDWRIPTQEEWAELSENCTFEWTTVNGVHGCVVTSTVEGYETASIFLPAAGFWSYNVFYPASTVYEGDYYGVYVTSSKENMEFHFTETMRALELWNHYDGRSIRPVKE